MDADTPTLIAGAVIFAAGYLTEAGGEAQQRAATTYRTLADRLSPDTGPVRRGT